MIMLDFKPKGSKHGWRNEYKWRKSKVYGFKPRRYKIDSWDGRHLGMRAGLTWYDDYRPYWAKGRLDSEEITKFLARHLGEPVEEVIQEYLRRTEPVKGYSTKDGRIEALKYHLGIDSTYRRRYYSSKDKEDNIGWSGFGVDEEGRIKYVGSAIYNPKWPGKMRLAKNHREKKKWNKRVLSQGTIEPDESRIVGPIGPLYVQRLVGQGKEDIPEPQAVWLINTYRWDHRKKFKGWSKDLLYLKRFERVVPVGCDTEYMTQKKDHVQYYWMGPREGRKFYYYLIKKDYEQVREIT